MADEHEDALTKLVDDEQFDEAERDRPKPVSDDFMGVLQDQFGSAPWWVISAVTHAVILALLATIVLVHQQTTGEAVVVEQLPPLPKPPEMKKRKIRDIVKSDKIVEVDAKVTVHNPVIIHEKIEITDNIETDSDLELNTATGEEEAISDIPLLGTDFSGNIGIGDSRAGAYGFRTGGGRKRAAMRHGGSKASESAVDQALAWLARNQERDGSWLCEKHGGSHRDRDSRVALTGLALLAFLGAGHTERVGKYRGNVIRGIMFLNQQQDSRGAYHKNGYNHAIAGLAVAEAFGMAGIISTGQSAQMAIYYSVDVHQNPYGGWRYKRRQEGDMSVTGWFIMQLKSAKVARLRVPVQGWQGAINFLDACEMQTDGPYGGGLFGYKGPGSRLRTSAIGSLCRLFLGYPPQDVMGGAQRFAAEIPGQRGNRTDLYYWYYATLVMFQVGSDHWKTWNDTLRPTLVNSQIKGGADDGSWAPDVDSYGERGGRVFTTALGALCLEVYYRYLPMYR